jgi:hypothetical protein
MAAHPVPIVSVGKNSTMIIPVKAESVISIAAIPDVIAVVLIVVVTVSVRRAGR